MRRGIGVQVPEPEAEDGTYTLILCEVLKGSLPVFKEFEEEGGRAAVIVVTDVDRLLPRYVVTLGQNANSNPSNLPASQIPGRVSFPRLRRSRGGTPVIVSGNLPSGAQSSGPSSSASLQPLPAWRLISQQPGLGLGSPALSTSLRPSDAVGLPCLLSMCPKGLKVTSLGPRCSVGFSE